MTNKIESNPTPRYRMREYKIYKGMLSRCRCVTHADYRFYGGRGISVCERWASSFDAFISDMGKAPEGFSIERINVDGNYEPGNCEWIPRAHQARNTRKTVIHVGDRFGRLIVRAFGEIHYTPKGHSIRYYDCLCDCGQVKSVPGVSLRKGQAKSCGCLRKETARLRGLANRKSPAIAIREEKAK